MPSETDTIRVQLNYPAERVREPVLYQLVTRFGLVPNVRAADFSPTDGGFIYLELTGEKEALERGIAWLGEIGIELSTIGFDGTQEWAL
ncbi:MAG TPA: NIL domain-containing protein [Chthonomonadales bacterium]|nr:NIL domain-containing protein [Chthonomonadales bacterium]